MTAPERTSTAAERADVAARICRAAGADPRTDAEILADLDAEQAASGQAA